jgi:hypothetical protein
MNSIQTLATFFGWCTVLDAGLVFLALVLFSIFHDGIGTLTAKMFGVTNEEAKATLLRTFMQFRIAIAVLNLVPYVALKIMAEA